MLQSVESQRIGHNLVTEQQQIQQIIPKLKMVEIYIREIETLIIQIQETEFWEQPELAWKQILPQLLQKGTKHY